MKEAIENNYFVQIESLEENNDVYSFDFNNNKYIFTYFNRSLSELKEIIKYCEDLNKINIKTSTIILNKKGYVLTPVNELNYILLKVIPNYSNVTDLDEIINNSKKLTITTSNNSLYRNNWAQLWDKKIDYYEYQIREMGKDISIVLDSFGYYAGLANNAIQLVNSSQNLYNSKLDKIVLSHRRIFYPNYYLNYYNPLGFILDLQVRDIAEYIKAVFFANDNAFLDLKTYLQSVRLTNYEYQMLYARLLYPSYYFDVYDRIMNKKESQDKLIPIISKVNEYESFLKKAYLEISKYAQITKIDWLIN